MLEGSFEFLIEGSKVEAGAGSLIYVPKGNLHVFKNTGNATGRMLVSQTPGGVYEGFVEEIGERVSEENAPPTAEEPLEDVGRVAEIGAKYGVEMVPSPLP